MEKVSIELPWRCYVSEHKQLMTAEALMWQLKEQCDWYSGVPSGRLKALYREVPQDQYYFAPREDHALAMAFGARILGKKPCVFMQNSGVGYIGDVVLGLYKPYKTGVMMVVDCIGEGPDKPPQHRQWGYHRTKNIVMSMGIRYRDLLDKNDAVKIAGDIAWRLNEPVAIFVREGVINAN
jgi:sulfopyruvate decarboxylase TPP-binding subunit